MTLTADDLNKAMKSLIDRKVKYESPDVMYVSASQVSYLLKRAAELKLGSETIKQLQEWQKERELEK